MANATSLSTLDNNIANGGTNTQNVSPYAAPYVTDMLGKAQAVSNLPYQVYQGPLTAGQSGLQSQAFQGLGSLTVPSGIQNASNTAGNIATNLTGQSYAPTAFTTQYTAPQAYTNSDFANQYAAPVSQSFTSADAQQYMNPYLQAALDPQIAEARRQAQITQVQNAAKLAQAGAFGGSRQAIMDAENQRNLGTNLANITGQGYNTAFNNAQQQFNADQARKIQEAQLQAQYGMSAAQAAEASKQFGAQQGMTAAQLAAQYGLSNQQATEASKQFGANYGLQSQQAALQAAQAQANLANLQNQANLGNLNAQLTGGAQQRGITAEGIAADKAEFERQRQYPQDILKFQQAMLSGLPIASVTNTPGEQTSLGSLLSALGGATSIANSLGYGNTNTANNGAISGLLKDLYGGITGAINTSGNATGNTGNSNGSIADLLRSIYSGNTNNTNNKDQDQYPIEPLLTDQPYSGPA